MAKDKIAFELVESELPPRSRKGSSEYRETVQMFIDSGMKSAEVIHAEESEVKQSAVISGLRNVIGKSDAKEHVKVTQVGERIFLVKKEN